MSAALEKALREVASTARGAAMCSDEMDPRDCRAIKEVSELALVLARILAGKSVYRAFGAPGDWGYETPIGAALNDLYRVPGAPIAGAVLAAPNKEAA